MTPPSSPRPTLHAASILDLLRDWRMAQQQVDAALSAWRAASAADDSAEAAELREARSWFESLDAQLDALDPSTLRDLSRALSALAFTAS